MPNYVSHMDTTRLGKETMTNINDLIARHEADIRTAQAEVNRILDAAKNAGYDRLNEADSKRADALLDSVDIAKGKLAEAKRIKADEDAYVSRNGETVNADLPKRDNRTARLSVSYNERTYRPDTDPKGMNFLNDVLRNFLYQDPASGERLQRHIVEERVERPGVFQKRAAGDVNTGNWAGLVVPQYLTDLVAPQISNLRPFADVCCVSHVLPDSGMSVNFSKVTTGSAVGVQASELATLSTQTLDDTLGTANVQTAGGYLNVSRQAIERGTGIEEQSFLDLARKYAVALDSTLINQATTGLDAVGQTVTYTSASPTPAEMWPFLMQANSKLEQALEGVAFPTHAVMHSRRFNWLTSYVSSQWPFIGNQAVPAQMGGAHLTSEYGPQVRAVLSNGLKVVVDNNVPTTVGGSQDVVYVVSAGETMHLWESAGSPLFIRAEQPNSASLGILLVCYGYFAYATRYTNPASKIFGTGTAAPAGF